MIINLSEHEADWLKKLLEVHDEDTMPSLQIMDTWAV